LLRDIDATEFLQAVTLWYTYKLRETDLKAGKSGASLHPVSAKRHDMLQLPLQVWKDLADPIERGFCSAAKFLSMECIYDRRELPYSTQIVPLAAVMACMQDQNRWREHRVYKKLARWYWCGVLGEWYGSAADTQLANDYEDLMRWINDDAAIPRTVKEAFFQPDRLDTLYSRTSAVYKGIHVLILREGAKDWYWKGEIRKLNMHKVNLDIHHIFPKAWCEANGIPKELYDSVLNKTSISYRANRKIGDDPPSIYLPRIQNEKEVQLNDAEMDELLASHALSPTLMRKDDFHGFIEDRRQRLLALIEKAMGKPVIQAARADLTS